jgi:hypothetical protein
MKTPRTEAVRWVRIPRFCELSGYTDKAVRAKMEQGVWLEGREWRRAPDGHVFINPEAVDLWVEGKASAPQVPARSRSSSDIAA